MKKIILLLPIILLLSQLVYADLIFSDDFESGSLSGWALSNVAGAFNWTASTTNPYQGTWHAQSQPRSTTEPASVLERTINTIGYQNITFSYYRRLIGIDAADEFQVEWFNGATWTILEQTGGSAADDASYLFQTFNLTILANNNPNFKIKFECTAGAVSEYCRVDNVNISGISMPADNEYPQFSNFQEAPANNTLYAFGATYRFNTTITNTNGSAGIEFNGINYSASNLSNIFNTTITNPSAGTYSYYWWAYGNGTSHNYNKTTLRYYTIAKEMPILTYLANGMTNNLTLIYPQQINISAIANYGTVALDRNNINVISENSLNKTLGAGSYIYRANITGNQNYSDVGYKYYNITILKASQTAILNINETSPIIYGTYINVTCNGELFRDNINVTNEKSIAKLLGAGSYNYSCRLYENQNYTYDDDNLTFVVAQANTTASLLIAPLSPITYETASNFSCSNSAGLTANLYINGIDNSGEKGLNIIRGVGNYLVNCTSFSNENYTGSSYQESYIINQATQSITPLLNGMNNNLIITYPQQINTSYSGANQTALSININSTSINIGENYTWGTGGWLVNYSALSNQNYSAYNGYLNLTINKANSIINLTLNHTEGNATITIGSSIWLNATKISGEGIIKLYSNGNLINEGNLLANLTIFNNIGLFNITAIYLETQNYSQSSKTFWVNVTNIDIMPPYFITIPADKTINYTQGIEVNFDAADETAFGSYKANWTTYFSINQSGALKNTAQLAAGIYKINVTINDSSNNLNSNIYTLTVNRKLSTCTISSNTPQEYPAPINVSGSCDAPETMATLYRDNVNINNENGIEKLLGVGAYNYIINVSETQNYTDANNTINVIINQNTSYILSLLISPDIVVTYPTETNVIGSNCPTEISCILYKNNISQTNPETKILGANSYIYVYNTIGNTNYTGKSTAQTLIVNQNTSSVVSLYLNHTQSNITILNGTAIWVNGTLDTGIGIIKLYNNEVVINEGAFLLSNYTWFNTTTGLFNITVLYSGNENYSAIFKTYYVNITLPQAIPDTEYPIFSNYYDNNGTINSSMLSRFNVTLLSTNSTVLLQINNTNYTASNLTDNEFNVSISLTNGTYAYQWISWGNGTNHNYNETKIFYYIINTTPSQEGNLILNCEVGGPYQQGALILIQGNITNETSPLNSQQINISIYNADSLLQAFKILITSNDGSFETSFLNLAIGSYILNVTASYNGLNKSCKDQFQIGSPASLILDKLATIQNITNSTIIYNITLRLINTGNADALNITIIDNESPNSPYNLSKLFPNADFRISYLISFLRQSITTYYLSPIAIATGTDTYANSLILANSTIINITIPPTSTGKQIIITKNIIYFSETSLNVSYNVTSTLYNSGDEDLTNINYIDTDVSSTALIINLTKGNAKFFSDILKIAKAASNTQHQFALGTAIIDLLSFYSNQPIINIPGYGGPADIIVHAPSSINPSENFNSIIQIKNINLDIGQDFTFSYWITNNEETLNYTSGQQTIYIAANSSINTTVTLISPASAGIYKLKANLAWAAGTAASSDSFEIISESSKEIPPGGGNNLGPIYPAKPREKEPEKAEEKEIICNPPYIKYEKECCLDENSNSICDNDEKPEVKQPEQPQNIITLITGLITNSTVNIKIISNFLILIINILIAILAVALIIHILRKKRRKHDATRLKSLIGIKVYSSNGMEIGRLIEIFIENNKIHSLQIKLNKKKKFKLKGIIVSYKYVEAIKDIILINEKILEKIQNG